MVYNKEEVEKIIDVTFENDDLIKTACTHRSYLNELENGAFVEQEA